jgi:HlyD family secretion protein
MAYRARSVALSASLVLLAALSGGCQLFPKGDQGSPALLPRRVAALGRVEPLGGVSKVSVPSSLSNDRVREIFVVEGQRVEKDQPLAILESLATLQASVHQAKASIAVAERKLRSQDNVIRRYRAKQTQANAEARRAQELYASGATSANRKEAQLAEAEAAAAQVQEELANRATLEAELIQSRTTLAKDEAELDKATIRAPYAGTIFKLIARPGDKIGEGGLLEMGDSSRMGVIAEIYQSDLPDIRPDQAVTITADGFPGKTVRGKVSAIARQVSRQSVFSGESGDNVDRRVVEVKVALPADVIAKASRINYMQVNVVFDPLTPDQRQQRSTQP